MDLFFAWNLPGLFAPPPLKASRGTKKEDHFRAWMPYGAVSTLLAPQWGSMAERHPIPRASRDARFPKRGTSGFLGLQTQSQFRERTKRTLLAPYFFVKHSVVKSSGKEARLRAWALAFCCCLLRTLHNQIKGHEPCIASAKQAR